jgi:hypothetical protein
LLDHHRPVDAARVSEGKPPMENAKHIGCMWALAVALGVGMAVANTPAVALAEPADSGTGSPSGGSSPSSSSRHSGSTSSDTPSARRQLSATNDAPGRHRRPLNPPGETAVSSSGDPQTSTTTGSSGSALTTAAPASSTSTSSTGRSGKRAELETHRTDALPRGGSTPAKTSPNPAVVNTSAAEPTVHDSSLDLTRPVAALAAAPVPSTAAAPAMAPLRPVSKVGTPTPADPVSRIVLTVINAVLSPFANRAPTAPVHSPADFTLLAFARREFEPSKTVNPPAGQVTSSVADPGFISSTHDFGLFSTTSAADPSDDHYVAFVFSTPLFTNILTSGADPEDNLGFGPASIGVAGQTVNTFISPFLNFTIAIPIEDPFAELFTELVRLGL